MHPKIDGFSGADWLGFRVNEESVPRNLPLGLALELSGTSALPNLTITPNSALQEQTAALQKLFKDLHATRTPDLEKMPPSSPSGVDGYRRYLDVLKGDFASMSFADLILSTTPTRLANVRELEYEYPVLVSSALVTKLKENGGQFVCNPEESPAYRQGFVKEIGPVSMEFVKALLFAIKKFGGDPIHLKLSQTSWEEGALCALIQGLAEEEISFGSLDISDVSSPDGELSSALLKLAEKPFATLTLSPGQMTKEDLEKAREFPLTDILFCM